MATPTLVATAGSTTANTYATLVEALSYFDAHLYGTNFTGATDYTQRKALLMATRILDEQFNWAGYKHTEEQSLRWPRSSVIGPDNYDVDYTTIPDFLRNATAEFAGYLIAEDRTAENETKGFKEMGAGALKVVIDKGDRKAIIPDSVKQMLQPYGTIISEYSNKVYRD